MTIYRWCGECGDERPFEQPPCVDGHGTDCPEGFCVECGLAVIVGDLAPVVVVLQASAA